MQEKDEEVCVQRGKALWCMKMVKIQHSDIGGISEEKVRLSFKKRKWRSADPVIPMDGYK